MQDDASLPEPDRIDGAPHPRETARVFGQETAEKEFLAALAGDRLHHAWMLTGPKGIGKATLAWRMARYLIATPPTSDDGGLFGAPPPPTTLDVATDHPVARRMLAGSEPGLFTLKRPYDDKAGRLKKDITVDEVRRLKGFFSLSATEGGRRVVIVDAADEMNVAAANALLKVLEEPPKDAMLLLVTHQPSRLLPTIRSRTRVLRLSPLPPDVMGEAIGAIGLTCDPSIAELSAGSVGTAIQLINQGGAELYTTLVKLFSALPSLDRSAIAKLGEAAAARGAAEKYDLLLDLIELFLSRVARAGAVGAPEVAVTNGEASLLTRLAPHAGAARDWAMLQAELSGRMRHGQAVNLDPAAMVLDTCLRIEALAAKVART